MLFQRVYLFVQCCHATSFITKSLCYVYGHTTVGKCLFRLLECVWACIQWTGIKCSVLGTRTWEQGESMYSRRTVQGIVRRLLLLCEAVWFVTWGPTLRRNILPPSSEQNRTTINSSQTLVRTYQTTRPQYQKVVAAARTSRLTK